MVITHSRDLSYFQEAEAAGFVLLLDDPRHRVLTIHSNLSEGLEYNPMFFSFDPI